MWLLVSGERVILLHQILYLLLQEIPNLYCHSVNFVPEILVLCFQSLENTQEGAVLLFRLLQSYQGRGQGFIWVIVIGVFHVRGLTLQLEYLA